MERTFCVDCLQEALRKYRTPEIFKTDQGAQFTSDAFIGALTEHYSISISRDRRGRALDNILVEQLRRKSNMRFFSKRVPHRSRITVRIKGIFGIVQNREAASVVGLQYTR